MAMPPMIMTPQATGAMSLSTAKAYPIAVQVAALPAAELPHAGHPLEHHIAVMKPADPGAMANISTANGIAINNQYRGKS
jgi:hypothetical protein